jgi:hypothetical protein
MISGRSRAISSRRDPPESAAVFVARQDADLRPPARRRKPNPNSSIQFWGLGVGVACVELYGLSLIAFLSASQ